MIDTNACVKIHKRRKYADIEVDLWNNPSAAFDFSAWGAKRAYEIIKAAFNHSKCRNAIIYGGPNAKTCIFLHNVTIQEAERARANLCILLNDVNTVVEHSFE